MPGAAVAGLVGTAAATSISYVVDEMLNRALSKREKERVSLVVELARNEIAERLRQGDPIREDGFFTEDEEGYKDGSEVLESVLLRSQTEPERRKLPYMAHLFANLPFESGISPQYAHQIVKVAENLTYRQMCLLKLAANKSNISLRKEDYRGHGTFAVELKGLLYECSDMYQKSLIHFGGEVLFGPTDVKPASMTTQGMGADVYNLMKLNAIPTNDIRPIAAQLA